MTRKSRREIESAVDDLGDTDDRPTLDELRVVVVGPHSRHNDTETGDPGDGAVIVADFTG